MLERSEWSDIYLIFVVEMESNFNLGKMENR